MKKNANKINRAEFIRIANYYYKFGFTQEEIAQKMKMSRQRVNRILSKCVDYGIVKIVIPELEETYFELETALEKQYGLHAVRIADSISSEHLYSELGNMASQYLTSVMKPGDIIGFSRGRSVAATVEKTIELETDNITAVQLMGSWNDENAHISSDDIVHRFSEKTGARAVMLHVPVVVKSQKLKETIMLEPYFIQTYEIIKACNIAVVGIGDARYKELLPTIGLEYYDFINNNAVGEICTHFYDIEGRHIKAAFNERVISIELEDFLNIPLRLGVAGSDEKLAAIIGALKGKLINALVTDLDTAKKLMI